MPRTTRRGARGRNSAGPPIPRGRRASSRVMPCTVTAAVFFSIRSSASNESSRTISPPSTATAPIVSTKSVTTRRANVALRSPVSSTTASWKKVSGGSGATQSLAMVRRKSRSTAPTTAASMSAHKGSASRVGRVRGLIVERCPSGWWLVVGGWWLVVGGWWLVVGGWWLVVGGWSSVHAFVLRRISSDVLCRVMDAAARASPRSARSLSHKEHREPQSISL